MTDSEKPVIRGVPIRILRVEHETRYRYDAPVELANHMARLRPRHTATQRIRDWHLVVEPLPDASPEGEEPGAPQVVPPGVHQSRDTWGNWRATFSHSRVHDQLVVRSTFQAQVCAAVSLQMLNSPAWEKVAERLRYRARVPLDDALEFALPSAYAPRDAALAAFANEVFVPGTPLLAGAFALMHLIHRRFEYRPSATSVSTRAPEALAQRRGVCQDFAHVMIGAMRSLGLSARYVSGYLLTQPPPGQPRLVGADASHAWVQVWCPVHGWVALDPTNAVLVGPDHVTLAWGRDYEDVAPLRGVIRGGGRAIPEVAVTVEPIEVAAARGACAPVRPPGAAVPAARPAAAPVTPPRR
ncbi:transglutaminase family protein [Sphaerotilus hippei]|nr:transglutaminase family protein [Sphaerotilus hippei]